VTTAARRLQSRKSSQQGYALLMVVFMATMLLLLATMVAPNIRTEGQREKEKEMIWRGRQYARGVKLYYRKLGRFPTSIDDLTKPKIGSLRFMRQAYKDPMNTQDGSWRLIYVGPSGQLIGSLKPPQANLQFGQVPGMGTPAGALATPGAPGAQRSGFGAAITGIFGSGSQTPGATVQQGPGGMQMGTQPSGTGSAAGTSPTNAPAITGTPVSADQGTGTDASIPMGDTPTIVGGNIIGVGSKINRKSVMVYDHATNYRLFEFIWDPSKDTFGMGQPGMQTGTGLGQPIGQPIGAPGQSPFGQQPGQNPANPQPNPTQPQNPQQQ
jgi:hypothetical protein